MQGSNSWGYSSDSDDGVSVTDNEAFRPSFNKEPHELKCDPQTVTLFPVRLRDKGNINASVLYDVEGRPLKDQQTGVLLNVYTKAMQDAFDRGALRLIHCLKEPSFRYFVTNDKQKELFQHYRKFGASHKLTYHVYVDEDVDRNSYEYIRTYGVRENSKKRV